ncbi:MAG TPA: hypothetical protein VJ999_02870 [Candidatus Sulfotelmatobacter sp.]|nr:hypothetical protein [Candidatus Sulfotelmatobacter sp.]
MRLSNVAVAAVLFISPALVAQHSSTSSSSSSSSSSHASSGGGGSSHTSSSSGSGSGSHSASSHTSSNIAHSASSSGSGSHSSTANNARTIREPVAKPVQAKEKAVSTTKTAQPEKKSFFSFLRHPFHKATPKSPDPDLRRPICKKGPCKKPAPPVVVESELRPPCKGKGCPCPPGGAPGKNGGCVAAPTNNTCAAGQYWNGGACVPSTHQCPANEYWNGASCVTRMNDCATIDARAASLANEVRGARAQMQNACSNNSSGQECGALKQSYDGAVERYRMLLNEAPVNCRGTLADPISL